MIEQLRDDDDALLMAYVAGELPADDAAALDQRLATDPALRDRADRARRDYQWFGGALAGVDQETRLPVAEEQAVRRVSRMMQQWTADRLAYVPPPEPREPFRIPAWTYPVAAGVALFTAFCFWWANNPPQVVIDATSPIPTGQLPAQPQPVLPQDFPIVELPEPLPLAFQDLHSGGSWDRLSGLESEMANLAESDEAANLLWTETNQ